MNTPLVSVIIPSYDRAERIVAAIRSVQSQSFQDFEIIVVDDGSRDGTDQIVSAISMEDTRIRCVRHPANRGAQAARNTGIRSAEGEWVALLDSDDQYLPTSLETRLLEADNQHVKVVHSECLRENTATGERVLYGIRPLAGMIFKDLLRAPGPVFPALLIHASALKGIGYLDESIVSYQEWDTSLRLSRRYEFGFAPQPTFVYCRHGGDTISGNPLRNARGYEQIVQKNIGDIRRLAGRESLAAHFSALAVMYFNAREKTLSRSYVAKALLTRPSLRRIRKLRHYIF